MSLLSGRQKQRFNFYDPMGDWSKPDEIGLVNNESDYEFGSASLARRENITIVAANLAHDYLSIQFKWRPAESDCDDAPLVCLATKLQLKSGADVYEHEEILTYVPHESAMRPGRILQYGGAESSLKMIIAAPYRRHRLVFHGTMKDRSGAECFVKARFIMHPTKSVFDFLKDFGPEMSIAKHLGVEHDKHEQMVQLLGEGSIVRKGDCDAPTTKFRMCLYGFYAKMFPQAPSGTNQLRSKHIMATMSNGQTFQLGQLKLADKHTEYGFANFDLHERVAQVDRVPEIDWDKIGSDTEELEFEVSAQKVSSACRGKKLADAQPCNLFDIEFNGKKGWASIVLDDSVDSTEEQAAVRESVAKYCADLKEGNVWSGGVVELSKMLESNKPLVVSIDDPACTCSDLVGSKASSLALLRHVSERFNYTVTSATVLTRYADDLILEKNPDLKQAINQLEELIGTGSSLENLQQECQRLQSLIADTKLPGELCAALESSVGKSEHYKRSGAFAVRSSSWGEDEEDMSAAGQLSTYLGVRGADAIGAAVMKCFASKFSFENVEYKRQHGLRPSLPMAVVVQEMVECEKAGVMFTCDPTSGDTSVLTITANYGLGESVVSGQAEPDTIRVRVDAASNEPSIERVEVGQKKVIITDGEHSDHSGGREYDRSKCCLADDEILRLARCGLALAHYFQSARDIEWGFREGHLFMFQSRPVTGLDNCTDFELMHEADQPSPAEIDFCSRANMGEVMPFAVTPLTLSYSLKLWSIVGAQLYTKLTGKKSIGIEISHEIVYSCYHAFFSLRNSQLFSVGDSEKSLMAKSMEIAMFGREVGEQPDLVEASRGYPPRPRQFEGFRFKWATLSLRWSTMSTLERVQSNLKSLRASNIKMIEASTNSPADYDQQQRRLSSLWEQFISSSKYCSNIWLNHIFIILFGNQSNMILMAFLSKYIKDPTRLFAAVTKFFAATPDVVSAQIPRQIKSLAQMIKSRGSEKFVAMSNEDALKFIREDEELSKEYKNFLNRFGHRCYNEFEYAAKSWRENQSVIIEMLKQNCKTDTSNHESGNGVSSTTTTVATKSTSAKHMTITEVIDSLNLENLTLKDKLILKHMLAPKCQLYVAARERTKDTFVEYSDIQRELTRKLGQELRQALRIPDQDLVYYLLFDELQILVREPNPQLVVQAFRRRNLFKKEFKDLWLFDEIIPGPWFTPNHLKLSKELDEALLKAPQIYGTPASSGRVQAKVCLVKGYAELNKVRAGDILVTHSTDIAFSPVFPLIVGIITEVGGLISHGAVVAREYGLPSLLGIPGVTQILQDGEEIVLDADQGTIFRLDAAAN